MSDQTVEVKGKLQEANEEVKKLKSTQEKVDLAINYLKETNDPDYQKFANMRDESRGFFSTYVQPAWDAISSFFSGAMSGSDQQLGDIYYGNAWDGRIPTQFGYTVEPGKRSLQFGCTEHGGIACGDFGCKSGNEMAMGFFPLLIPAAPAILQGLGLIGGAAAAIYAINAFLTVSKENRIREEAILNNPKISNVLKEKLLVGGGLFGISIPWWVYALGAGSIAVFVMGRRSK